MKRTRLALLIVIGMLAALLPLSAAPALAAGFTENFDNGSGFVTNTGFFSDGSGDYFGITDGVSGDFGAGFVPSALKNYTGFTGSFLTGMDLNGDQDVLPVTANWSGIDITGIAAIEFSGDFAEYFDSPGDIDAADYLFMEYQIDGGGYQKLLQFSGADFSSGTFNGIFREDTNFDGVGDGLALGNSAQTFTKPIPGTGTVLDLRLTVSVEAGDEDFAVDNFFIGESTGPPTPADPVINEFVANHAGTDTEAFVEVFGDATTDYSTFTVLEIEGEPGSTSPDQIGTIDAVLSVGTTDGGGYWTDPEDMENGTVTILLVESFSGSAGVDLDSDNDGVFDATPWTRIVDDVAVSDGGGSDVVYSTTVLAPYFDGNNYGAGGASRIPNAADTDTTADWVRNDFDGFGFPGFTGSPMLGEAVNTPGAVNEVISVLTDPLGVCGDPATSIHDIQGTGAASTDVGSIREIEGVVVGDFQDGVSGTSGDLNGFFLQEEDTDADADPLTSEGIFVYDGSSPSVDVAMDDVVRVRASVAEYNGLTEMTSVSEVDICGTGTATSSTITLPVASLDVWETVEGMSVTFPETLFVSGNYTQGRYGEVDLSVNGPLDNPTNVVAPGAAAIARQELNDRSRIQLEDGRTSQNPVPPPYFPLRTGDSTTGLTGVISYGFDFYELHPTQTVEFTNNPRPTTPPSVGGSIQVAAFNVLNYFTTIDNGTPICGPDQNQDCRGADTEDEFTRQRDKIISAISQMGAEVVGLMEIENHPGDTPTADLVDGLNAAIAPGTYDYIATGAIGGDAIRQAVLYQPASVTPLGVFEVLDSSDNPLFDDTLNRPMLTQSFVENATGAVFTVAVNHLKSKGSDCNAMGDPDTGDGQGNCNVTRTNAAQVIVDWLETDPTGVGDSDYLVIGDMNSYAKEDPIAKIRAAGYTDLIEFFAGTGFADGAYSYNYFSQSGYLDHGLASPTMALQVAGTAFWHINADEAAALDYNDFNQESLYSDDAFRASDHDPVVIGLALAPATALKETASDELSLLLSTGNENDDKFIQKAIDRIDQSLNPSWWIDASTLDPKDGGKVFDRGHQAVQELEKVKTVDVQSATDAILTADRQLALKQLIAAIIGGGNPSRIQKAMDRMADAAENLADGNYAMAVLDYKKAWQEAIKAQ